MPKLQLGVNPDADLMEAYPYAGVREIRMNFSEVVHRAGNGERIIATYHGRAVAAFVPVSDVVLLKRLKQSGLYAVIAEKMALEK